jgi:serine/threonine protein phosphatase PrpC
MAIMPPPTPASHRSVSASQPRPKAHLGSHTLQSFGKGTNENQDAYVVSANGSKFLAGVFDGHGERGKKISHFAKDSLQKNLFSHKELHNNPRLALESAYRDTQNQIERSHGTDAAQSGTTAVACYQHRDRLLVANVGDSRAVLGRCDTARKGFRAVELTSDQKPSRPDEKQRVLQLGGKVDQMSFPVWNPGGGLRLMRGGPERVMDSSGFGGLAMSRSLGDLSLHPYVTAQPEVSERKLDSRDRFLVLGSDGVWDQMSSQEAVDIASRITDPVNAAKEITTQARRRWNHETEGLLSDDITAVVVRLDHDTPMDGASTAPGGLQLGRTAQNFRSQPGSGAVTPVPGRRDLGRNPLSPMKGHGVDRFNASSLGQRPLSHPEGNRRHEQPGLRHSSSDTSLNRSYRRRNDYGGHSMNSMKQSHMLPPAGR